MVQAEPTPSPERAAILNWTACMGAVTAEAVADHVGTSIGVARGRLQAAARNRLLVYRRPLAGRPALYTITAAGGRVCGVQGLDPCRVTASNARHLIECARVAAALGAATPTIALEARRELRRDEREHGRELASVRIGGMASAAPLVHRPDLILWPACPGMPVAVEVELTVKAPRRLADICRAWARCRCVAGVLYLASPEVEAPLARAIERAHAGDRVLVGSPRRIAGRWWSDSENRHRPGVGCRTGVSKRSRRASMSYFTINRVILIGRLTRDPETRSLPSGTGCLEPTCGVQRQPEGRRRRLCERPNYFDVSVFGASAESVDRYMRKGSRIAVDGHLEWREWETADNQRRQAVSVVAETVQFLDSPAAIQSGDGSEGEGEGGGESHDGELVGVGAGAEDDLSF